MTYRILSLDGGGSWALMEVQALIALFGPEALGHKVLSSFDLIAANSGGSIVLGCLIENMRLSDIQCLFMDKGHREEIFAPTTNFVFRLSRSLGIFPKYSTEKKLPALEKVLTTMGGRKLNDGIADGIRSTTTGKSVHLLIVSFDYDRNRATFFRSGDVGTAGSGFGHGEASDCTLAQAIHGSTNAPVKYFDAPASFGKESNRYWDGGITGCNNPALAAAVEALGLGAPPEETVLLTLGTGTTFLPPKPAKHEDAATACLFQARAQASWKGDLGKIASSVLDDPPDVATFHAHLLLDGHTRKLPGDGRLNSPVVRMNPMISPVRSPKSGPDIEWLFPRGFDRPQNNSTRDPKFKTLVKMDMDAIKQIEVDLILEYANLWLQDGTMNQPVRLDGKTFEAELGQTTFSEALLAWHILSGGPA